jgi:hypothetical protein
MPLRLARGRADLNADLAAARAINADRLGRRLIGHRRHRSCQKKDPKTSHDVISRVLT